MEKRFENEKFPKNYRQFIRMSSRKEAALAKRQASTEEDFAARGVLTSQGAAGTENLTSICQFLVTIPQIPAASKAFSVTTRRKIE